jgi:hypothetical protein
VRITEDPHEVNAVERIESPQGIQALLRTRRAVFEANSNRHGVFQSRPEICLRTILMMEDISDLDERFVDYQQMDASAH